MKRKLNDTFQDGDITLRVELPNDNDKDECGGCYYNRGSLCIERDEGLTGRCDGDTFDDEDIIFVKQ